MYHLEPSVYQQLLTTGVLDVPGAPFYPLQSAGMPLPGVHFAAHAESLGDVSTYEGVGRSRRLVAPGPLLSLLHFQALYSEDFALPVPVGNKPVSCKFLRGHRYNWTPGEIHPCPVMVLGKHPGAEEEEQGLNFQGPTSELFWRTCDQLGIDEIARESWYLTNLVRFRPPDQNASKLSTALIEDCAPLLYQELRLVRPKYILCLGADTCRELTGLTLKAMRGRVEQFTYQIGENEFGTAQVMAVLHPAQVYNKPEMAGELNSGLALFWRLLRGDDIGGDETDVDHRVIDNEEELRQIVDEILADPNPASLVRALDAEWHGRNPWDPGAYLRTIQFSHKEKFAVCVKLRHPGGAEAFTPNLQAAYTQIRRLVTQPGAQIGGHFLRSDIPWFLLQAGIDLRPYYRPLPSLQQAFSPGSGWETNLMEHAVNETGPFGLEALRSKYTTAPPYEVKLERWRKAYCLANGLEEDELEGFGDWDEPEFYSYACYDADVTWRIYNALSRIVAKDSNGHDCREAYWRNHRASLAVLEMEMEGVVPDPVRIEELAGKFAFVRNQLINDLRVQLSWPTFNPASDSQCRAMLFGDRYARKMAPPGYASFRLQDGETPAEGLKRRLSEMPTPYDAERQELTDKLMPFMPEDEPKPHKDFVPDHLKEVFKQWKALTTKINGYHKANPPTGSFAEQQWIYLLPEGAIGQNLKPVLSTGKRKKLWSKIEADKAEDSFSPSTDKTVLGILSERSLIASQLRDTRFLGQMLNTTLRRPDVDKATGEYQTDEDGDFVYEKGLLSYLSSDGRVHGRQRQDKETGRGSMSKPNLQAISSRREDNYRTIMGYWEESDDGPAHRGNYIRLFPQPLYTTSVKSIFIPPPGFVFMESDYTGAEIAGIMWLSQDPQGMDDVRRNLLPENHPEYQDIHSMMAVRAFKLQCEPTKKALKKLNKSSLRTAAKGVVFGTPYGISAQAITMACLAEGTPCTEAEAQAIIDYYFERYPMVKLQLEECVKRVYKPGHLCGVFGRRRRFMWTDDEKVRSDQERQAKNFRIQNLVADSVWTALGNMYEYRERRGNPDLFKFSLQIHDAIRLAVPYAHVPEVYRDVFPQCMFDGVDVWPCDFDGYRLPLKEPYHLQGSREIGFRAGESIDDVCEEKLGADHPKITQLLDDPKNDGAVIELLHKLAVA